MRNYKAIYDIWCKKVSDEALLGELKGMSEKEISDCFYKDLEFGTGGLRGELGAGTNNLNIYTMQKHLSSASAPSHPIPISYH